MNPPERTVLVPAESATRRSKAVIAVPLVILGVVLLIFLFDWSLLKNPLIKQVGARLDRVVEIRGELDVKVAMTPVITIDGIVVRNASWAKSRDMLQLERLQFSIDLKELLLHGRLVVPRLELHEPILELEKNADGKANWRFKADSQLPEDRTGFPTIGQLHVANGKIHLQDATRKFDINGDIASITGKGGDDDDAIKIVAKGKLQNQPFNMTLEVGSLHDLRDEDHLYPVKLAVNVADTRLKVTGSIDGPFQTRGLDVTVDASGPNLSELQKLTGLPLPGTPPYRINGQLKRTGNQWVLESITGTIGDSDIAGLFKIKTGGERLYFTADLSSRNLDFDDLGPIIGAPPGTGAGETVSPKQAAEAAAQQASPTVIPDKTFNLKRLRSADADVHLRAANVIAPKLPLQDFEVELKLRDGVMTLKPLRFGLADGDLTADITLDATQEKMQWDYEVTLDRLKIGALVPSQNDSDWASGTLGGKFRLHTAGNSMHETAANSDGSIEVTLAGGRLSNLAVELIGLDIAESLGLLLTDDKGGTPFRCAVAELSVNQGILKSRRFVIDTVDTRIDGELEANLDTEDFKLTLNPKPKDVSPFALRGPIHVTGSFKTLKVRPDVGSLGLRVGVAAVLGAVATPAAALLAFVEPGPGIDVDCQQVFAIDRVSQVNQASIGTTLASSLSDASYCDGAHCR